LVSIKKFFKKQTVNIQQEIGSYSTSLECADIMSKPAAEDSTRGRDKPVVRHLSDLSCKLAVLSHYCWEPAVLAYLKKVKP
jgi:hypothetical protein